MTMGADPVACAALAGGADVKAFFVRKEAKAHGLSRRIEGPLLDAERPLPRRRGRRQHRRLDDRRDRGAAGGRPRDLRRRQRARPPRRRRRARSRPRPARPYVALRRSTTSTPTARRERARVVTIGVYGFTLETFLAELRDAGGPPPPRRAPAPRRARTPSTRGRIRCGCRRRSPGPASRISHRPELAPTTELRQQQYRRGRPPRHRQRSRVDLAPEYVRALHARDPRPRRSRRRRRRAPRRRAPAALLCVERDPEACHRSLIVARLADEHGVTVEHLRP